MKKETLVLLMIMGIFVLSVSISTGVAYLFFNVFGAEWAIYMLYAFLLIQYSSDLLLKSKIDLMQKYIKRIAAIGVFNTSLVIVAKYTVLLPYVYFAYINGYFITAIVLTVLIIFNIIKNMGILIRIA